MVGSWHALWHLANSVLTVKARGSTVASSGCVVYERKCCGKKEPSCKPSYSQAGWLKILSNGFSVDILLPACHDLGNNRHVAVFPS